MRITGGNKRRHGLKAPAGWNTRPTSDRVREALFNILMHHDFGPVVGDPLANARVLDAFCGTGALAFEALSRGAASATLFDIDRVAVTVAQDNAAALGFAAQCAVQRADAAKPPRAGLPCNLLFLDPPYRKNLAPKALLALDETGWLAPVCVIVIETAKDEALSLPERYAPLLHRVWGDTAITIMAKDEAETR